MKMDLAKKLAKFLYLSFLHSTLKLVTCDTQKDDEQEVITGYRAHLRSLLKLLIMLALRFICIQMPQ